MLLESVEATRRYESGLFLRHLRVLGLGFESPSFIMGFSEVRLPTINIDYSKATSSVLSANSSSRMGSPHHSTVILRMLYCCWRGGCPYN